MNSPVDTRIMTPEMAIAEGAMALFGEKYGDEVRVVTMGGEDVSHNKSAWSVELCGGTHVNRTGDIGSFKIISESAVAGGVRRIEAVSQNAARRWFSERETILDKTATLLKSKIELVPDRVANLLIEKKKLEAEITQLRQKIATGGFSAENRDSEKIGNTTFIGRIVEDTPAKELKPLADQLRLNATKTVICLAAIQNDKISIVVALTPDCEGEHDAVGLVRIAADAIGGTGGGGRFDMAQAGGNKPENANAALESVRQALAQ